MTSQATLLTREGRLQLEHELDDLLRHRRPELRERLREAFEAAHGNTAELGEYQHLVLEQARLERRIAELQRLLAAAEVAEAAPAGLMAELGSTVVVRNEGGEEQRYTLVGAAEAAPRRGRISIESPVGRALLGHRPGDVVEVVTPGGRRRLQLLSMD